MEIKQAVRDVITKFMGKGITEEKPLSDHLDEIKNAMRDNSAWLYAFFQKEGKRMGDKDLLLIGLHSNAKGIKNEMERLDVISITDYLNAARKEEGRLQ